MRRDGDTILGSLTASFQGGSRRFFFQGTNERWRGVVSEDDLALYDARVKARLSPACADWVARGRFRTDDPDQRDS